MCWLKEAALSYLFDGYEILPVKQTATQFFLLSRLEVTSQPTGPPNFLPCLLLKICFVTNVFLFHDSYPQSHKILQFKLGVPGTGDAEISSIDSETLTRRQLFLRKKARSVCSMAIQCITGRVVQMLTGCVLLLS